ncbi:hypothetical protein VW23_028020 [Devosia insulae DS-56]|uniref:DUF885 domain-containing protein n=1 Tax=Devosia insulae DS-56 TaxID=1116389 RepID=A0A1E5XJW3_9HYPH|nr:DUF885 family protein [Devosia insulae]OEO28882.1 hypothetical protein VW23_028020 [Devosia insulae DS-56]
MTKYDPSLVDDFLSHHWTWRPVDATFMGDKAHDALLPPVGDDVIDEERRSIAALRERLQDTAIPDDIGNRLDRRMMLAELAVQDMAAAERSRLRNPAWYSGEAAFAVISLLLPQSAPVRHDALIARLGAIPGFLHAAAGGLARRPTPAGWVNRARREAAAMAEFLAGDIKLHEEFADDWASPALAAAAAFTDFATAIAGLPDADPACGEVYLARLFETQHGLSIRPASAVDLAEASFERLGAELEDMAAAVDPNRTWEEIIAGLSAEHPGDAEAVIDSYMHWDVQAVVDGHRLVTPAQEYDLDYRWMAPCFRKVSQSLYFLFYRSPPGLKPGEGSVYWVTPPGENIETFLASNNRATVKTIHSVHHGSVGHHTQNTRARASESRLARIAGTDCALGLAFLGSITLIEGWACYVEDLLMEAPGFYSPAEVLLLKQYERRNAASVLVDVRLHTGEWSMEEAMAFYRDKAGFAPARVEAEVVRNSMMPGSRAMYWLGVEGIRALRRRWKGDTLSFHDTLLSFGHVPLAWIGEEMHRAGLLNPGPSIL